LTADAQVDDGDFGALTWYVVLAERIDPLAALQAVDGWGGDSYIAYTQNEKTCMRLNWQGDTSTDQQEMQDALNQWAAAMPAGAATVTADGGVLHLQACDLGPDSGLTLNNRANDAIQIPGARSQFMLDAVKNGGQRFDAAFKYGDCMVHHIGFENFVAANQAGGDGLPPEVQAAIQAAFAECRSEVGG
jgi:hypothetical protein